MVRSRWGDPRLTSHVTVRAWALRSAVRRARCPFPFGIAAEVLAVHEDKRRK